MKYSVAFWCFAIFLTLILQSSPFLKDSILLRYLVFCPLMYFAKPIFFRRCPKSMRIPKNSPVPVFIVTGSSSGIGAETAAELVRRGAKVIWAARDTEKANEVLGRLRWQEDFGPRGYVLSMDLADLESIRKFVEEFRKRESKLNGLILNAAYHGNRRLTKDGFEQTLGVNHLGHMYLTYLLKDMLVGSATDSQPSRVVVVCSDLHRIASVNFDDLMLAGKGNYSPFRAYNQSKLCNILFSNELAKRLQDRQVRVHSAHPGTPVQSDIMRNNWLGTTLMNYVILPPIYMFLCRRAFEGAQTLLYCALSDECAAGTSYYFENCRRDWSSASSRDPEIQARLWKESCKLLKIEENW